MPADPRRPRPARARRGRRLRRRAAAGLGILGAVAALAGAAWAYWSANATAGSVGAAVAATVGQGATPTASAVPGRKVDVSWGASTLTNGHAVDGYVVRRYDAGTGALQTTLTGCTGTVAATSCTERGVPAGQWRYSVTPVFGAHWLGAEGLKSGTVTVAAATITLATSLFGAPLPQDTTGSLAGFADGEGVTYRLDGATALTGSPSAVGSAGTATIGLLAIPSTTDGAHTVWALGDATPTASAASTAIVVDTTAPTVGAQLTPAASASGWNITAPVALALSADDGTGSGIDRIRYTTDGSDPRSSGSAQTYASALSIVAVTTVRFVAIDVAGNVSAVGSQLVRFDATAPVNVLSLSGVSGGAHLAGTTVYYRGSAAGSFTLTNAATDAGGSGIGSSATAALTGTSTGWSHASSVVTTPAGGPYVSAAFAWSAGTSSAPGESVTSSDTAGNTTTTALTFTPDSTGPAGGALTVNGSASSSTSTTGNFAISRTDYTDADSGLVSSVLTRETATLSSSDGIAAGTCGSYRSASVLVGAPAQSVSGPACYRYTLTGTDEVGNVSSIAIVVTVDTTAPGTPALTLSAATGDTYISGATVFINAQGGRSGGFQLAATTTDADSGIQKVNFPALTGFSSGGGDDTASPFATTYAWSGAVGASGSKTVTATNNVAGTATQTFTVTPDTT
ncbi:MAG TPA: chitobiase/beta-hexosaminidase C-terminal domain-containing protein, partial [Solirubrobacteraceae bacterium]|nr:chitobiase/beta-hexosaminidase C-terminal domain-containing protein [Solirubrobacteraceae bacterium]